MRGTSITNNGSIGFVQDGIGRQTYPAAYGNRKKNIQFLNNS
jgi:hypothetical protein